MESTSKIWEITFPDIDGADEKLKEVCIKGVNERYSGNDREKAEEKLVVELDIIHKQGSASGYLTVLAALNAAGFNPGYICLRGSNASSLVSYVTGLSQTDPLMAEPRLYPEFYYGIDGGRLPAFEMNVDPHLQQRLKQ